MASRVLEAGAMKKTTRRLALDLQTVRALVDTQLARVAGGLMTDPTTDTKTELCDATPASYLCAATVTCSTGGINTSITHRC
jgi:hypothetical protein